MSSGTKFDGIWTSGIDNVDRRRAQDRQASVRADRRRRQRRLRPAAPQRAGPQGRRGDQPVGRRRRRRRARPPDPRRQEAGEHDGPRHARDVGQRHPRGQGRARRPQPTRSFRRRGRSGSRSRTGPRTTRTSSSPARAPASSPSPSTSTIIAGMSARPASPRDTAAHVRPGSLNTDDRAAARGDRRSQSVRRGRGAPVGVARRPRPARSTR